MISLFSGGKLSLKESFERDVIAYTELSLVQLTRFRLEAGTSELIHRALLVVSANAPSLRSKMRALDALCEACETVTATPGCERTIEGLERFEASMTVPDRIDACNRAVNYLEALGSTIHPGIQEALDHAQGKAREHAAQGVPE